MKDFFIVVIAVVITMLVMAFGFLLLNTCFAIVAHSAEHVIIEFTSAEDLIARKDSVIAVCDTVGGYWEKVSGEEFRKTKPHWYVAPKDSHNVYVPEKIYHRTLVGVTVMVQADSVRTYNLMVRDSINYDYEDKGGRYRIINYVSTPGTAIVWFKWEEE